MRKLWVIAVIASAVQLGAQSAPLVEWPYWGGDAANTRYSTLPDITPANVHQLERAWEWAPGEKPNSEFGSRPGAFEATPIMIDNVLYLSTAYKRAVALDAETGKELWSFDPEAWKGAEDNVGMKHRGVAAWRDGNNLRIFLNTDSRLFSLDAKTGKPVPSFGEKGVANLTAGLRLPVKKLHSSQTSPPVVYKNFVIVGSRVPDRIQYKFEPPGTVQAFDARTGKRAWVFYTVPQAVDEFGANTWENESWNFTGHANVWGPMTLDESRGLLYVPTSTPGSDYWGGRRYGANLFAESLVCLDANTGKRVWHFQAVHHGLWDYDLTSPPSLATVTVDGRRMDVVAQVSKQGFAYVFERATGRPVWPIEERPVDTTTDVPGERPWPTQPFPTKPPAFSGQGVSLDDANDLTPEIKALAREEMSRFRLGPLFTPPSLRGTLQRPTTAGGANWGGTAFDPETGLLYLRTSEGTSTNQVCKNDGTAPDLDVDYTNNCEYGAANNIFQGHDGKLLERARPSESSPSAKLGPIPLIKPPYAYLVAINLNKGDIEWRVPLGEGSPAIRQHPLLKGVSLPARLGTPGPSSMVLTKTGLILIGAGDPYLYAFDKATGKELWRTPTPRATAANPMTYRARSGRQFVLIAGGAGPDAVLTAFALGSGRPAATQTAAAAAPAAAATSTRSGADAFREVCQSCHGADGRGGLGPPLAGLPMPASQVLGVVREGIGQMPPISATELTDAEVNAIAEHLRTLR